MFLQIIFSFDKAAITLLTSEGFNVAINAPELSRPNGFIEVASQQSKVIGEIIKSSLFTTTPTLDAVAISIMPVESPPSVKSCIECTLAVLRIVETSLMTLIPGSNI